MVWTQWSTMILGSGIRRFRSTIPFFLFPRVPTIVATTIDIDVGVHFVVLECDTLDRKAMGGHREVEIFEGITKVGSD